MTQQHWHWAHETGLWHSKALQQKETGPPTHPEDPQEETDACSIEVLTQPCQHAPRTATLTLCVVVC